MVSFKSLFFFATAALVTANPLQVRSYDADLILVDLKALDDSVKGLTAAIDAYEGAVEAGPILSLSLPSIWRTEKRTLTAVSSRILLLPTPTLSSSM